jgi:hypothetical protein
MWPCLPPVKSNTLKVAEKSIKKELKIRKMKQQHSAKIKEGYI